MRQPLPSFMYVLAGWLSWLCFSVLVWRGRKGSKTSNAASTDALRGLEGPWSERRPALSHSRHGLG
jgi:hypothetical protein